MLNKLATKLNGTKKVASQVRRATLRLSSRDRRESSMEMMAVTTEVRPSMRLWYSWREARMFVKEGVRAGMGFLEGFDVG